MNVENNQIAKSNDNMCKGCQLFYAAQAYKGYCSKCFKKKQAKQPEPKQQQKMVSENPELVKQEEEKKEEKQPQPQQKDRKRCYNCNKKIGLLGIECKCGMVFCNRHRLPEDHDCGFNHQEAAQKKLQKQIVKVYNGKISQI